MQSKTENHTMRVFYLLAIVFVVDGHTTLGNLFDLNGLFRYYSFHLMMFAFGSGYFFKFYGGAFSDFAHRAKKLLVPLYLWNAVYGVGAALLRRFGEHLARPNREIGVGQPVRAADAPAHLIELTQPEVIRVVDNQRVRHRDIQTGFDDRRAQQHVKLLLAEIQHHVFQRVLAHLAVRNRDARLRHEL